MPTNESRNIGRNLLKIPGPTPIPERILSAMSRQMLDHRGPEFQQIALDILAASRSLFRTANPVFLFPSSGTGAWEAAFVNTLSPGDAVLVIETGHFAVLWSKMAAKLGLKPEVMATDWHRGADADALEARLQQDKTHQIKAVCVVHNETSTGTQSSIPDVRGAMDAARHPALLMVDAVSSIGAMEYRHDEWGVDVAVAGSQKGLMLPPGLSLTAVSQRALAAAKSAKLIRSYWSWDDMLASNSSGAFPYTPPIAHIFGLAESLKMLLDEEGIDNVAARHERLAETVRRAVKGWGLETWCRDPKSCSPVVTTVAMPEPHNSDAFRKLALETFNMSIGSGLNKLAGKAFRIAHLGYTNELTVLSGLAGVEMTLELAGIPHEKGGVAAAMSYLTETARPATQAAA